MFLFSEPPPSKYDVNFKFDRFPVRIHPFFWLIAALITWVQGNLAATVVGIACVALSILVHEYGHAAMARKYGCRNVRMLLHGMGGLAMYNGRPKPLESIVISLAGPGAGFLLGGVIFVLFRVLELDPGNYLMHHAVSLLLFFNVVWGLLNLVPLYPLDGGQVSMTFLQMKMGHRGRQLALKISIATGIGLGLLAVMAGQIFLAMFAGMFAWENWQMMQRGGPGGGGFSAREPWQKGSDWWR